MKEIYLEQIDSTNLYGKAHLSELSDKTVIFAGKQYAGHGRLKRSWVDLGGDNLFLSFILKPSDTFIDIYSNLPQYLSVVVCKVLQNYNVMPEIKWPNDVLIGGKKIAGILAETVVQGNIFKGIILGIGVNLNADKSSFKLVKDRKITALNIETGRCINSNEFRIQLCKEFFYNYEKFLTVGFPFVRYDYLERSCFLGKDIQVKVFDKEISGFAKSVTDRGELVLLNNENEFIINMGDIL